MMSSVKAAESVRGSKMRYVAGGLLVIGAALLVIGAFLPWVNFVERSEGAGTVVEAGKNGIQRGDGLLFVVIGVLAAALAIAAVLSNKRLLAGWLAILLAVAAGILAFIQYDDVSSAVSRMNDALDLINVSTAVGAGIYALGAGAAAVLVGGIVLLTDDHVAPAERTAPPEPGSRVKCPLCAELIQPDAKACRYCGFDLTTRSVEGSTQGSTPEN